MRVLGISGGNGVMLHPFKNYLIGNIEPRAIFHTKGDKQWNLNFNGIPITRDIEKEFPKPHIIIGHPNCGSSSVLRYSRAKKLVDPREDHSVRLFISSIHKYKPRFFLLENLPNFLTDEAIEAEWGDLYHLKILRLSVSEFGNSQFTRKRMIIVGILKNRYPASYLEFFNPFKVSKIKTTRELIEHLKYEKNPEQVFHLREPDSKMIPLYYGGARKISVKEARKIWNTTFKDNTRWAVEGNPRMKNQPGIFKLEWDTHPVTVRKQERQFDPDGYILTPRQLAEIQGIPKNFELYLDIDNLQYCLNKARATVTKCPPYEIGVWFKKCLKQLIRYEKDHKA